MQTARKIDTAAAPAAPAPRNGPTILTPADVAALSSPAHALHARLLDVFSESPAPRTDKLPVAQRLVVIGGLSVLLWAAIGGVVWTLTR